MKSSLKFFHVLRFWNLIAMTILACNTFATEPSSEESSVIAVIDQLFDGIRTANPASIEEVFYDNTTPIHTAYGPHESKKPVLQSSSVEQFLSSIKKKKPEMTYDERVSSYHVQVDDAMATAWTPYQFFVNNKLSHCGSNSFQLFKSEKGWKIISVVDTRHHEGCK